MKEIKIGGQFSGVGAFDTALNRLKIPFKNVYQAEWDKYARKTYLANNEKPEYYVEDVNDTPIEEITEKHGSMDIVMFSPPCQAFSLAGKRLGKNDPKGRGILFFNSLEFIEKNRPRFFIFENVKGLLSDDGGNTFNEWLNYLGGKSVNGSGVLFAFQDSVPYHIYWKVLNAKDYGVPQNRERVFIIGIRDDQDNNFTFPPEEPLTKRLKDVLESEVEEKYYLSEKGIQHIYKKEGVYTGINENEARCLTTRYSASLAGSFIEEPKIIQLNNQIHSNDRIYSSDGLSPTLNTMQGGNRQPFIEEPKICAMRGSNIDNPKSRKSGLPTQQTIEVNENGVSNSLTTVQKDNLVVEPYIIDNTMGFNENPIIYDKYSPCLRAGRHGLETISKSRIRKLTPIECFRLMDFPDSLVDNIMNYKKNIYFHFIYSIFAKNKQEAIWNAKLKVVKEQQTPKNLETYVLCTTKECIKMEALMTLRQKKNPKIEKKENALNVNFAIEVLGDLEQKECATNIIKWTDCTETLYTMMLKKGNQVVMDISDTITGKDYIEPLWKITLEENLKEERLFITLILLKQIIKSKIYTYVKMRQNTQKYISSIINYEKNSDTLLLSYLRMDYTEQLVSDSMLYKQAGNSIVVAVLEKIIKRLKL